MLRVVNNHLSTENLQWLLEGIKSLPLNSFNIGLVRLWLLDGNDIRIGGGKLIAELIERNDKLVSLNISKLQRQGVDHNFIGVKGMEYIAKALVKNNSLVELKLSITNYKTRQ